MIKEYWEAICYYCDRIYRIEKGTKMWKCKCGLQCYIRKFQKEETENIQPNTSIRKRCNCDRNEKQCKNCGG